jgi:hypothetical protein
MDQYPVLLLLHPVDTPMSLYRNKRHLSYHSQWASSRWGRQLGQLTLDDMSNTQSEAATNLPLPASVCQARPFSTAICWPNDRTLLLHSLYLKQSKEVCRLTTDHVIVLTNIVF